LSLFFAEVKLTAIGADEIRAYQRMRMTRAGPVTINHYQPRVLDLAAVVEAHWPLGRD